jgi:dienelactone hydrolase
MAERRRRTVFGLSSIVLIGVGTVAAAFVTTRHTPKSVATAPVHYSVGIARCTFVDMSRSTPNYANATSKKGRVLVTEIRYPTLSAIRGETETSNAHPALRHGPFPLVIFGHGYALTPDAYKKLLDRWVEAGFVVAAPLFPDTNQYAVANLGFSPEADDINQPADMAFVTKSMIQATNPASALCPVDHSLVNHAKIALAGQSDGATTAVALGFDSRFVGYRGPYRAVVDLSGELFGANTQSPDTLSATNSSPALFVSQSATDTCNPPQFSKAIYNDVHTSKKWFLTINSAHHLPPYIGTDVAAFNVVATTTSQFLADEFAGKAPGHALVRLGNAHSGVASLATGTTAPGIAPLAQGPGSCYLTS